MQKLTTISLALIISLFPAGISAQTDAPKNQGYQYRQTGSANHPAMREDEDGDLQPGEYTVIDLQGSVTRALCPYVCADRGLPPEHCKAWQSASNKALCYLQDTRIQSNAIEFGAAPAPSATPAAAGE